MFSLHKYIDSGLHSKQNQASLSILLFVFIDFTIYITESEQNLIDTNNYA